MKRLAALFATMFQALRSTFDVDIYDIAATSRQTIVALAAGDANPPLHRPARSLVLDRHSLPECPARQTAPVHHHTAGA